jgi:hypothetical protein
MGSDKGGSGEATGSEEQKFAVNLPQIEALVHDTKACMELLAIFQVDLFRFQVRQNRHSVNYVTPKPSLCRLCNTKSVTL